MNSAIKVFKKTAPNGKFTCYLNRRDFVDHLTHIDPVDGVVVVSDAYLSGRVVYAQVTVTYRYGREEEEVIGLHFSKEIELLNVKIYPTAEKCEPNKVQEYLTEKLGDNVRTFSVTVPKNAPNSVILEPGSEYVNQPLGVIYNLCIYVANKMERFPHKYNSLTFAIRKVQFASIEDNSLLPQTEASKSFLLSQGKLIVEAFLSREVYYHGQQVRATLEISNESNRTVKSIKCHIIQHIECTMTKQDFNRIVACRVTRDGCPVYPGNHLKLTVPLTPRAAYKRGKFGVALDGQVRDRDSHLASSTLAAPGKSINNALGVIISYSFCVTLTCGTIAGELAVDLPFKLVHPVVTNEVKSREHQVIFEEFARLRRGKSLNDDF
ncbi:arrestin homolog [Oratosquilla oratoria]|uniref:arrestin homolog n=1 Tax=Oratosquilla oratoria TaxID=337810 RepID=UPI003F776FAC